MGFFRYPGGKNKLSTLILPKIQEVFNNNDEINEYREPFFGGGSIGLKTLDFNIDKFWINDYDCGIASIWYSVINRPEELKKLVMYFKPSVEAFYHIKNVLMNNLSRDLTDDEKVLHGFYKIAIHQTSYSGLGTKSGGPLGGKKQKSIYDIACRWSPEYICKKIDFYNKLFSKNILRHSTCTCFDYSALILDDKERSFLYLDPPYYVKGNDLYQFGFSNDQHYRLANLLKRTHHLWLLSYDFCDEIENMYKRWANIEYLNDVNYSINTSRGKQELLISNF